MVEIASGLANSHPLSLRVTRPGAHAAPHATSVTAEPEPAVVGPRLAGPELRLLTARCTARNG